MPFADPVAKGTWTPTILGGAGVVKGHTYSLQNGVWNRVGNLIFAHCQVVLSALGTIDGSVVVVGGLPFPVRADANYRPVGSVRYSSITFSGIPSCTGAQNASYVSLVSFASAGATTNMVDSALSATASVSMLLVYETDL